jgi:fluoride ion exporter CrcB/FEX
MHQQAWLKAGGNMLLSVALCLLGTCLGFLLSQSLRKTA